MKFRTKLNKKSIRVGKYYYVNFTDPNNPFLKFRGIVMVESFGSRHVRNIYFSYNWAYCHLIKADKKDMPNGTLYINRASFKKYLPNYIHKEP